MCSCGSGEVSQCLPCTVTSGNKVCLKFAMGGYTESLPRKLPMHCSCRGLRRRLGKSCQMWKGRLKFLKFLPDVKYVKFWVDWSSWSFCSLWSIYFTYMWSSVGLVFSTTYHKSVSGAWAQSQCHSTKRIFKFLTILYWILRYAWTISPKWITMLNILLWYLQTCTQLVFADWCSPLKWVLKYWKCASEWNSWYKNVKLEMNIESGLISYYKLVLFPAF